MSTNRATVLILTRDPAFSRDITATWPQDSASHTDTPEFVVLEEDFSRDLKGSHYDLAIADASFDEKPAHQSEDDKNRDIDRDRDKDRDKDRNAQRNHKSAQIKALKQSLADAGKPAIMIHSNPAPGVYNLYNLDGAILELRREPGVWPAMAGLIGRELLCRRLAESRAREAEQTCAAAQAEATLGRYIVEMRTNINNALTTLLGNAELLTLEPGLPVPVQAQADTICNMALRLHEVFQRFSSIEKELTVAAREAGKKAAHATAGRG